MSSPSNNSPYFLQKIRFFSRKSFCGTLETSDLGLFPPNMGYYYRKGQIYPKISKINANFFENRLDLISKQGENNKNIKINIPPPQKLYKLSLSGCSRSLNL